LSQLNPHISFLHAFQKYKPTLVYDMIEEFRQPFVDRPIFSLLTKGNRYRSFGIHRETGLLNKYTKNTALEAVINRLATLVRFKGKKVKAEAIIQAQVNHLTDSIQGKQKTYKPFISTY